MTNAALKLNIIEQPVLTAIHNNTISDNQIEETLELFGWHELPRLIKNAIHNDMVKYYREIHSLISTLDRSDLERRKKIRYWIEYYLASNVSEKFVAQMLTD